MKEDITFFKGQRFLFTRRVTKKEELDKNDSQAIFIDTKGDEKETRRIVESLRKKDKKILVKGYDNIFNRRVLETMSIDYMVSVEDGIKKDNIKQRDSGLNHVLAGIAKKKGISFIIDINSLKKMKKEKKSKILSRIIQNIRLARKNGCGIKIASFAEKKEELVDKKERKNLLLSLEADTSQAKDSCSF